MKQSAILIVGAGAGGLIAAKELSAKGNQVTVLEAQNRIGGRIETILPIGFAKPVEAGAEFIHGNLPVTLKLLKEYDISYTKAEGSMMHNVNDNWQEEEEQIEGWDELMKQMNRLKQDMPFAIFLQQYFGDGKYKELRESAAQYAQGFDVANPADASTFALRDEWQHEEEDMYRVNGGYIQLINALAETCRQQQCNIHLSKVVKEIQWEENKVKITTINSEQFIADKALITVPVNMLQAVANGNQQTEGSISFVPAIPVKSNAANQVGFGSVIKVIVAFKTAFWQQYKKDALFFFSKEKIPVWWTQQPAGSSTLTGWLGGPPADEYTHLDDNEMIAVAVQSLAAMFHQSEDVLKESITGWHVANWRQHTFARGAYSYSMIYTDGAKKLLNEPVGNTLYFAGEALYTGHAPGTVEAALVTGLDAAKKMMKDD